jgi:hypothetical protein
MARKRTSGEADSLHWYRMECFKRSRYYEWLRGKLKESGEKEEDASKLERLASFKEYVRTAPVLPIASDGLHWMTVKVALDIPPDLVLASLERLLRQMQDGDEAVEWMHFIRDFEEAVEEILRREPRSALESALDATRPSRPYQRRVHLKDLKLRVKVWDRVHKGATFIQLARHFKRPEATVRDLFEKAALDICGSRPPRHRRKRLLQTLDPATHAKACPQCNKAKKFEDYCPRWKAYVNQDYKSLRELPVGDHNVSGSTDENGSDDDNASEGL